MEALKRFIKNVLQHHFEKRTDREYKENQKKYSSLNCSRYLTQNV
jgi:hypothetical protein